MASIDVNIITGRTGTAHITPEDDAKIWRGLVGKQNAVLNEDNNLDVIYNVGGQLTVKFGTFYINGKMGRLNNNVTIEYLLPESGNYRRTNLILRHKTTSGINSMQLMTLQNNPENDSNTSAEAESLSVEGLLSNDFILYDFVCDHDGVVSSTFKKRFEVSESLETLKEKCNNIEGFLNIEMKLVDTTSESKKYSLPNTRRPLFFLEVYVANQLRYITFIFVGEGRGPSQVTNESEATTITVRSTDNRYDLQFTYFYIQGSYNIWYVCLKGILDCGENRENSSNPTQVNYTVNQFTYLGTLNIE